MKNFSNNFRSDSHRKNVFGKVTIFLLFLIFTTLNATASGFVDSEPLLRWQKVGGEYTYPVAINMETKNYPDVFEVDDFMEIRLFYFYNGNKVNSLLENHLLISDKPFKSSFSISKYDHNNAVKMIDGRLNKAKIHRFQFRELWLYAHYSEVSKMMVVYMDSEKDGFIYDCKDTDNQVDRVGLYYPEGLVTYNPKDFDEIPLPNYRRGIKVDGDQYRMNLIRAMRRLLQEGKSFQPFTKTSIKLNCQGEDNSNVTSTTKLENPTVIARNYEVLQNMDHFAAKMSTEERNWWSSPIEYGTSKEDFYANIMIHGSKGKKSFENRKLVEVEK